MPEAPVTMPETNAPPPAPQPEVAKKAEPSILPTLFHEGYGTYQTRPSSFVYSYTLVTVTVLAFYLIAQWVANHAPMIAKNLESIDIVLPSVLLPGHDAGGGAHDPRPATKG